MDIEWKYFFGSHSNGFRTFDRYYKAEINGLRVEKHTSNKKSEFSIGDMDKAKVKYKTEQELLAALDTHTECPKCKRIGGKHFASCDVNTPS